MAVRTGYPDGAPCWADLSTPDLDGARRFYGALFDWTFDEPDPNMGGYANVRRGGKTVVGIAPMMEGSDMPTVWSTYLKTSDIHETARRIAAGGGNLLQPPMEIPGAGHMLFAVDATGAHIGAWQPAAHTGAQLFGEPGAMCWHEVATRDVARADAFYRGLFGYEQTQIGDGERFDFKVYKVDGQDVGGRMKMTDPEWNGIPPHWMVYFAVDDADRAAAKIRELGGKVMHGPFDSPYGRIAVVQDPYGATFSIIALTPTSA
jgi:uncharacterized protein